MSIHRTPEKTNMDVSKRTGSEGSIEGNDQDTAGRSLNRVARRKQEARDIVANAKLFLSYSGNLRRDVKQTVTEALDELLQMVLEETVVEGNEQPRQTPASGDKTGHKLDTRKLEEILERQANQLQTNNDEISKLRKAFESQMNTEKADKEAENNTEQILEEVAQIRQIVETTGQEVSALQNQVENKTYANIAATTNTKKPPEHVSYHSLVVTSKTSTDTGDEILEEIRKEVNATEKGIQVDRIRKAKNRKVIVSCRTEEGRDRVLEKLEGSEKLDVEEIRNKNPLIVLKDVIWDFLIRNSYQDIEDALRRQNKQLLRGLDSSDISLEILYTRKARNPHTRSVVVRVSPKVWQCFVQAGAVHLDLQRVRVADQSPLVQCSMCLGYGHSRRFCKETQERCSHCAGLHTKSECADFMAETPPTCTNCLRNKQESTEHNAFAEECPVRRKWDVLARASVAYC